MKPLFLLLLPLLAGCLEPIARPPYGRPEQRRSQWNNTVEQLLPGAELINETSGSTRRFYNPAARN